MVQLRESVHKIYINVGNNDVLKLVANPRSTILDVGCGAGVLADILSSKGHIVDAITISPSESQKAKQYARSTFLHNLENGLPEEALQSQYDYVVCSHILEHIVHPQKLLADIYKVLRPGGYLLVAMPNIMHYKSRMKLLAGNFKYQDAGIWDNTHVKWYTFDTGKQLLLQNNFSIELATVTGEIPFNSFFGKILSPVFRKAIFTSLTKISKGFFGFQLLYKVRKG